MKSIFYRFISRLYLFSPNGIFLIIVSICTTTTSASIPAFPWAEGFGSQTKGGRGGKVIEVTNLHDSGKGSLRDCITASGPRTCVFRVGGTIKLNSTLEIENPYITIAGHTAPGDGITLKNSPSNRKGPLRVETFEVIIRHLRSRPGSNPRDSGTSDAITIGNKHSDPKKAVHNIIIDHCTFSWSTDEVANIWYASHNISLQWCIIAEGLEWSTHFGPKGKIQPHSYGMLIGSFGANNISFHHNLLAHNRHRNPKVHASGLVDIVNNVIYNSGSGPGWNAPTYLNQRDLIASANYVGNYFKPGPDTGSAPYFIETKGTVKAYLNQNHTPDDVYDINPKSINPLTSKRFPAPRVTTVSPDDAYHLVLNESGANQGLNCDGTFYWRRDEADRRLINEVALGKGKIIDDPSEVGGWPRIASGTPCEDSDHDGMPNVWEKLYRLNPNDSRDNIEDFDDDGYTNFEEYLNGTHPGESGSGNNTPPKISAGVDLIAEATKPIHLNSVAIDDGLPLNPKALIILWKKLSGPGAVSFKDASILDTIATFSKPGHYLLRLRVSDGNSASTDDIEVKVLPFSNSPPVAKAGFDMMVIDSDNDGKENVLLDASSSFDSDGFIHSYLWKIGNHLISSTKKATATLTTGKHTIQLIIIDDDNVKAKDHLIVTVKPGSFLGNIGKTTINKFRSIAVQDSEEYSTGKIKLSSSDLDLGSKVVGLRFSYLNIPTGATIKRAYIQFTSYSSSLDKTFITIHAQGNQDGPKLTGNSYDLSDRELIPFKVPWNPPPWKSSGLSGTGQRTPDLKSLLRELVNRSEWKSGDSMVFIFNGTGNRSAVSYNLGDGNSPSLYVEYTVGEHRKIDLRVNSPADDSEQIASGRNMTMAKDLDLGNKRVGLRFQNLAIPRGAEIINAYLQFTASSTSSKKTDLTIYGEDADNAISFLQVSNHLSSRRRTSAKVAWTPPPWRHAGESRSPQRTPNIGAIIQEIVNRPGWSMGNDIAFFFNGNGARSAFSFDGNAEHTPQLHIDYQ